MSNLTFNRYNYKNNSNNYISSLYLDLIRVNIPDDIINIILDYTLIQKKDLKRKIIIFCCFTPLSYQWIIE